MLVGDVEWPRARGEKRMAKLEASIHAISGKFETYDVETTEPLVDTAMDSIPRYVCLRLPPNARARTHASNYIIRDMEPSPS